LSRREGEVGGRITGLYLLQLHAARRLATRLTDRLRFAGAAPAAADAITKYERSPYGIPGREAPASRPFSFPRC
jgi:hypothetical protein